MMSVWDHLSLSTRARKALRRYEEEHAPWPTWEDFVATLSGNELFMVRNCGTATMREIRRESARVQASKATTDDLFERIVFALLESAPRSACRGGLLIEKADMLCGAIRERAKA